MNGRHLLPTSTGICNGICTRELQRYLHRVSSASPLPDGRLRSLVPMTAPLPLTLLILTLLTLTLSAAVRVSEEIADKNELICK